LFVGEIPVASASEPETVPEKSSKKRNAESDYDEKEKKQKFDEEAEIID
jgi:hypothetical protein